MLAKLRPIYTVALHKQLIRLHCGSKRAFSVAFASVDPDGISRDNPYEVQNFVNGKWNMASSTTPIIDPVSGDPFLIVANTKDVDFQPFMDSLRSCPKSGLHNPFKSPERYLMYGDVSFRAAALLRDKAVEDFFTRLIQRVAPKTDAQARGEVVVTRKFLENFGGDQVRYLAKSSASPGDHLGQEARSYRFPYGPVAIITPFNFPLEIPALQLLGALYMGNKVVIKSDSKVSLVLEQFVRLLHHCGMPISDVDLVHSDGPAMHAFLLAAQPRMTLFTGSSRVGELLARDLHGRIKLEDAGFDWKILGPDVATSIGPIGGASGGIPSQQALAEARTQQEQEQEQEQAQERVVDYVAYVCDQDAYGYGGQKCSAQSILFAHENWVHAGLFPRLKALAERRQVADLSIPPVLSVTNEAFTSHLRLLLDSIPGAKVLWGGEVVPPDLAKIDRDLCRWPRTVTSAGDVEIDAEGSIPTDLYGCWYPTAVYVPLESMMKDNDTVKLCTKEIFGPFQVVTSYTTAQLDLVLSACEKMEHHLTAGIVSNDPWFQHQVLGRTVNGTTYVGLRARTTGAPQNHWFGPAGDPRGAGIGTKEAIQLVWSCQREVVVDQGPIGLDWATPAKPT